MRCQKLILTARNLLHRHDAAGFGPYSLQLLAILTEQIARRVLFRRHKEARFAVLLERRNGIALFQLTNRLFFDKHACFLLAGSDHIVLAGDPEGQRLIGVTYADMNGAHAVFAGGFRMDSRIKRLRDSRAAPLLLR